MNDIIHLLPDSVANQIAAGEVVQRPASVIKELVENSLDAGAKEINVYVTDGGKTSIQVVDDGKGMSETDARLSFERHSTSKISSAADLYSLTTMGFRGEALASIAAVSEVELKTRRKDDELGTHIRIAGSRIEEQNPVACAPGANFSVKNIFFNVPARRKFLKSNQTELTNILTEFERVALVHPDIAMSISNNGMDIYRLAATTLRQRILDIFGKRLNSDLLPLEAETSIVRMSGFVGKPESAKKKGAHQYFFVNGRYMRHPYFLSAVTKAFENLVPQGEHVPFFIYFSVDPSSIDVNVHPTKTEIKFDNEQAIWQVLYAVVKESLGKFNEIPSLDFDVVGKPEIPAMGSSSSVAYNPTPRTTDYNPFRVTRESGRPQEGWESLYEIAGGNAGDDSSDMFGSSGLSDDLFATTEFPSEASQEETGYEAKDDFVSPCFQYMGRYIVTPGRAGILIVDQHRAHVQVLFDRYMRQIQKKKGVSQGLLFADMIQFNPKEQSVMESIMSDLEYIGFDLSNLGGGSFAINGVPTGIEGLDPKKLLHDLVYSSMEGLPEFRSDLHSTVCFTMAKSAAIVYGQVLSEQEMKTLLADLFKLDSPMRSPSGKVVFAFMEQQKIDAMF